jgi:hypothetical protein
VPLTSFTSTAFGRCRSHYINVTGNAFAALFRSLGKRVVYDIIEIGRCQDCGQSSLKAAMGRLRTFGSRKLRNPLDVRRI